MKPGKWLTACGIILAASVSQAHSAPPDEAILPIEQYTTDKARSLASRYRAQLRGLYEKIDRCYPWIEIVKGGLGFRKPKGVKADDRYLSLWVWVDQQITPAFASAPADKRASAMFQRYGVELLRSLSSQKPLSADPGLAGFAVVLQWVKPNGPPRQAQTDVLETLALFADKETTSSFLEQKVSPAEFVSKALIFGFDGKQELGRLPIELADHQGEQPPACSP